MRLLGILARLDMAAVFDAGQYCGSILFQQKLKRAQTRLQWLTQRICLLASVLLTASQPGLGAHIFLGRLAYLWSFGRRTDH